MLNPNKDFNLLGSALQIGYLIVIPLIVFLLIGIALDKHFNTKPLFILISLPISLFISIYTIYKELAPFLKADDKNDTNDKNS